MVFADLPVGAQKRGPPRRRTIMPPPTSLGRLARGLTFISSSTSPKTRKAFSDSRAGSLYEVGPVGRPGVLSDICRLGLAGRSQHLSEALEFSTREDTLLTQALVLPSDSASPLLTLTVTQELWWQVSWKPDHTNTCPFLLIP